MQISLIIFTTILPPLILISRVSGSAIVSLSPGPMIYIYIHISNALNTAAMSWDVIMTEMPTLGFVQRYQSVFGFDDAFMAKLSAVSDKCGYTSYSAKHVNYPPTAGVLPLPGQNVEFDNGCDIWDMAIDQALLLNPAFNIYRIFDVVRHHPPTHYAGSRP